MSEGGQPSRTESFLYDADGNRTDDESLAVRAETVELDAEGRVISQRLDWQVDPKSLDGDQGELATRPGQEGS